MKQTARPDEPRRAEVGDWVVLHEPEFDPVAFDPERWAEDGRLERTPGGRGTSWFVTLPGGQAVWRHFRRGGLFGRLVRDHYLFLGESRVRAFAELRLLTRLRMLGLPVPRPLAARYRRSGLLYTADLLTAAIPDARTLASLLDQPSDVPWSAIGAVLRGFHEAGTDHADLNAHNILLAPSASPGGEKAVWLIDFDRGRMRSRGTWSEANLARLRRSLVKIGGKDADALDEGWRTLLAGYHRVS